MMKHEKSKSSVTSRSEAREQEEVFSPPLDVMVVKVHNLRVSDDDCLHYSIRIAYYDQLIINSTIKAIGRMEKPNGKKKLKGSMSYDPSDYEKLCYFADCPLTANIQPIQADKDLVSAPSTSPVQGQSPSHKSSSKSNGSHRNTDDMSSCNIDVLPMFLGKSKMYVKKRMQLLVEPSVIYRKSWDNLPLLTLELEIIKNVLNKEHHETLQKANYMSMTLIGAYNMPVPFGEENTYTAATKLPIHNETNTSIFIFNNGYATPKRFDCTSFNPKWEHLRIKDDVISSWDKKFTCDINTVHNHSNIDLMYYLNPSRSDNNAIWASFHRTLMLEYSDCWLKEEIRQYSWPLEVHIYNDNNNQGFSFVAYIDLFRLLYAGEKKLVLAVPLQWINPQEMINKCGCEGLLTPNDNYLLKTSKVTDHDGSQLTTSMEQFMFPPTGSDENCSFVLLEVALAKPLVKITMPPIIHSLEINELHGEFDQTGPAKRECSGRGQLDRDWQSTVRNASNSLKKVPYHGMTEFCAFNRQLSETRTRVELTTSCWMDAAVYINNNFVVQDFLQSDETFEEMLMMAHACLMRTACDTLVGVEDKLHRNPAVRAARHARQMQDIPHAMDLYLQRTSENPRCANGWRELSTCLLDIDRDWAKVCIDKAVLLDPRNPLTLLSKACMIFDENPEEAEPFFTALLALFPFWPTGWVIASAYYIHREYFYMADKILECLKKTFFDGLNMDIAKPRNWEHELGDWWDYTPLLPGQTRFFDAADLLLRLRAVSLAETCLSRALVEAGETAAYYHLVSLCCRLRGKVDDALCHIQTAIEKYGEISYLRSLEAECYHKLKNVKASMASFEKACNCVGAYCTLLSIPCWESNRGRSLLVDLVRRQPSAYAWMALADDWMARATVGEGGDGGFTEEQVAAKACAVACAIQALKWDRKAGRAWALLAKLVKPSARRLHCRNMALACGYYEKPGPDQKQESQSDSKQSLCFKLAVTLRECRCVMCENIQF